ncbi:EAL domain-containing protein [Terasakiella sp. A23]|uniref:putative bifunctional diguanylate cyclase/phosphodiesterase n=1 Tax=Terasakiella sp. FCG-A23 TaxID=3080561 RepID=UPI0029533126|nr:EAL domain-containing protein [Terasakiella sp. A23]MDV7338574.1 EAL domain-containing protein [Terasakiella sp. A23]
MKNQTPAHQSVCESFVHGLNEAAILTDCSHQVIAINDLALSLLSFKDASFLMNRNVGCIFDGDTKNWPVCLGGQCRTTLKTLHERTLDAELSLSKISLEGQTYNIGILRDISVLQNLKDALEKAENRLDDMMGNLPVTLFQMVLKENGTLSFPYISKGVSKLMGVDSDVLMENPDAFFEMLCPADQLQLLRKVKKSALQQTSLDEEICLYVNEDMKLWLRLFANLRQADDSQAIWDGAVIDITGQHLLDERLRYLAYHDETTHMPNHLALEEYLQGLFDAEEPKSFALMALSIDRLDLVNETLGSETASRLVQIMGEHLRRALEPKDVYIAHLKADSFSIVMPHVEDERDVAALAESLLKTMKIPFEVGDRRLDVSVSMGISISGRDGDTAASLMMNADTALRRALVTSPGGYRFYVEEMNTRALRVLAYENRLRKALAKREFVPFFQPLIDVKSGYIAGMEALVRWRHPRLGLVGPSEFIPVAEDAGLIGELCHQVLHETCRTAKGWIDQGHKPIPLAVNISWRQFAQPERLMVLMNEVLEETGLPPEMLELELTESSVMEEPDSAIRTLNNLRDFGVMASIDDFGTGYSSLSYLKRLPISKLKIDRAFIHEVTENERDAAIVDAIIMLARALGLKTVAEGIETPGQLEYLREKGCDLAQGFYFSRPVPAAEMEKMMGQGVFSQTH